MSFALTYGESYKPIPRRIDCEEALRQTEQFWRRWVRGAKCHEEYRSQVERSLITLKALTYRPTGGIVAAATTSLPEIKVRVRSSQLGLPALLATRCDVHSAGLDEQRIL